MILLDTSVVIALAFGEPLRPEAEAAIVQASGTEELWVSAVSAWELGLLATRTTRTGPRLGDARGFFHTLVVRAGLRVRPLTARVALDAAYLPGPFHRDPSDRMIVAEARDADLILLTSDRRILDYAALGHVKALRV